LKYGKHDFAEVLRLVSLTGIFDGLALLIPLQALWLQADHKVDRRVPYVIVVNLSLSRTPDLF
jgi:hypothetical protein